MKLYTDLYIFIGKMIMTKLLVTKCFHSMDHILQAFECFVQKIYSSVSQKTLVQTLGFDTAQ